MSDKIEETTLDESSVTAGAKPADPQGKLVRRRFLPWWRTGSGRTYPSEL